MNSKFKGLDKCIMLKLKGGDNQACPPGFDSAFACPSSGSNSMSVLHGKGG